MKTNVAAIPSAKRLLVLTCGANACFHIVKRLREQYGNLFYIVGADINKRWLNATSEYLDAYYSCPLSKSPEYYRTIMSICDTENIEFLLPLYDTDQRLFYKENPDLLKRKIVSFGINKEWLDIYSSKMNTNAFLQENGFDIPKSYSLQEIDQTSAYFVKPKNGNGSIGAKTMMGSDIYGSFERDYVIQEVCAEPEVTLECFNHKGKVFTVSRERLASKAGVCSKARVYNDNALNRIAERLCKVIPMPILFNLQFMRSNTGSWVITDVNLRAAGGMGLSYAAGWDASAALGGVILGSVEIEDYLRAPEKDTYVVRSNVDIVTKVSSRKIAFDLDGTLLDSRKRHKVVLSHVLNEMGIELDISSFLDFKKEGHSSFEWLIKQGLTEDIAKQVNKRWVELIEEPQFLCDDVLYPGVAELLSELSKTASLYIITARNKPDHAIKQIEELGIKQFFDDIVVVESNKETSNKKANVLKRIETDVFYGDTESDYEAAKIAKCKFCAISNGFRSDHYWENKDVKPKQIIDII